MARSSGWLPQAIHRLRWGCENSPFIKRLSDDTDILTTGKELCLILWPFVYSLPGNVGLVLDKLPDHLVDARKLFEQLRDPELHYRALYRKQCLMTGISEVVLDSTTPDADTDNLCRLMKQYCQSDDYREGVLAVVTAELAATIYARYSYEIFSAVYGERPPLNSSVTSEEGLEWLKLHAKPHTRHAMWMKRTIDQIEADTKIENSNTPKSLPEPVEKITDAVLRFLRSDIPSEGTSEAASKSEIELIRSGSSMH